MNRRRNLGALCATLLLAGSELFAAETVDFENGTTGPLKPVSGVWTVVKGRVEERSDDKDVKGRPFFAVAPLTIPDNVVYTADFETFDGLGEVLLCPLWQDADNYLAAEWVDKGKVRLLWTKAAKETVLSEAVVKEDVAPPIRLGVARSGKNIKVYLNGKVMLEEILPELPVGKSWALGGRERQVAFDQVSVEDAAAWQATALALCPVSVAAAPICRRVFYRMESNATMRLAVTNLSEKPIASVKLTSVILGLPAAETELKDLAPKSTVIVPQSIPATKLRPDEYELRVRAQAPETKASEEVIAFSVVPRLPADRISVLMWGGIPVQGAAKLADTGFTAVYAAGMDYAYIREVPSADSPFRKEEAMAKTLAKMEEGMKAGLEIGINFAPGRYVGTECLRVKREGTAFEGKERINCPLLPTMQAYGKRAAEVFAKSYAEFPMLRLANLNTEIRDGGAPCFHPEDKDAFRKATGRDIPDAVGAKWTVPYKTLKDFPADRVVPDDHPLLAYYRWYWKEGDGWVKFNDLLHDTLKKNGGERLRTWFDPAARVAPVYGSGGHLDMIGNWTYSNPDPFRVAMTADELLNMAQGRQKVFQMVQAIWYRSQTAPKNKKSGVDSGGKAVPWDDHDPDADYITPSPAHLQEAFWSVISRPVDMIGYHAETSLFPGNRGGYSCTYPDSAAALARLHRILRTYGPMLHQIGNRPADVAFLESFASQVFAGRATFGWAGGGIGSFWHACSYAGLQMDIIYEETVTAQGLDRYKVLVLPECEVLPRSVVDKIAAFQKRGGLVIADELLVPALQPDVRIPNFDAAVSYRTGAEAFKAMHLAAAAKLREALAGKYASFAVSENPEIVLHTRERDGVQYLFAVNDRREAGDYVGMYGLVMENGLPAESVLSVHRTGIRVFDLITGREVSARVEGEVTKFNVAFGPAEGKIFVLTDRVPASLTLSCPETAARGGSIAFDVKALDEKGQPLALVLPIRFELVDPGFRPAEPTGDYAASGGACRIPFDLAENDRTGLWTVTVEDRLSGLRAVRNLRVETPQPAAVATLSLPCRCGRR